MVKFQHYVPVDIRFGYGVRNEVARVADALGKRGFLVADSGVRRTDLFRAFEKEYAGLFAATWSDFESNPSVESVDRAAEAIRGCRADFVLAVGGGSAMDVAKAACLVAASDEPARAYHTGGKPVGDRALPLVAMPTTAGTGSEVTPVAVLTDAKLGRKAPIGGKALLPRVALVDPEWTVSLPPAVTASCGMDALSHALEAYWSVNAQPLCDAWAEKAAAVILGSIEAAFRDGTNRDAREQMALGSLTAGLAFSIPKTAAVHACSFPLTQRFGLAHGTACALTLDAFLLYNAEMLEDKLSGLAARLGFGYVEALAARIHDLKRAMGMPCSLKEAGIAPERLDVLIAESFHPNMNNNPRKVTPEQLREIYAGLR